MRISKELFTGKRFADGSYPVVIRIYHKGTVKRVYTPVKCDSSHWNHEKECVTDDDACHRHKNETIDASFRRVAGKLQDFLDDCLSRHLDRLSEFMLNEEYDSVPCSPGSVEKEFPSFLSVIDRKIESVSSVNTKRGYTTFRKYFIDRFGKGPHLCDVNHDFISDVATRLEIDYPLNSSMRYLIGSRFNSVLAFGKDNGYLSASLSARLPKYNTLPGNRNLSEDELRVIFRTFYSGIKSGFHIENMSMLSLSIFILDIAFQGLAPVDLASLKVGDLRFSTIYAPFKREHHGSLQEEEGINGYSEREKMEVVSLNTYRRKTGRQVAVIAWLRPIEIIIKALSEGKGPDDYLIPCFFKSTAYSPEQRQNRLANYFYKMSVNLNNAIKENCHDHNLLKNKVTYYFARHAYCNIVDCLDIPRHIIQNLVGHRSTVLERSYLRPISNWEQAMVSREIFKLLIPLQTEPPYESH